MADPVLPSSQSFYTGNHGVYVHVDPATIIINASQVLMDGAGGTAFVPFTSPSPVKISILAKESDEAVDWASISISEHGVDVHFAAATGAIDGGKREARLKFVSGEVEKEIPVTQTWMQDRGFSLMNNAIVAVPAEGGTHGILLQTDKYWTVDCGESWITYDKTYGKGSEQIMVTAEENKATTVRYGFVKIRAGKDELIVELQQAAAAE